MIKIEHEEYHKTTTIIGGKNSTNPITINFPAKIKGQFFRKVFKAKTKDKKVKEVTEAVNLWITQEILLKRD